MDRRIHVHLSDFDLHSMAIRHLVAVYGVIIVAQFGYFFWVLRSWLKLNAAEKKSAKPAV
jgi:hypothetical protein